jgi:hypothetical protein
VTRATAGRLWEERTGGPFQPSDEAEVAPSAPLPPCRELCGWCSRESPCGALKRLVDRERDMPRVACHHDEAAS